CYRIGNKLMSIYDVVGFGSWLARFVPELIAYGLCSLIGTVVFYLRPGMRQAVLSNLSHVLPRATRRRLRRLARNVVINNFANYYDLVRLPYMTATELQRKIKVQGAQYLFEAHARGKGVIALSGHMG